MPSASYSLLASLLIAYVAFVTPFRDSNRIADAWEHHRAIQALTRHLWSPGNPTFASDIPSVRYSPYTVFWAVVCRLTGLNPYTALSIAAAVNTLLLVLGVWAILRRFAETASATAVLLVMVTLWGGIPGYANSYALADLPWMQVNPSAFSFAICLLAWSLFVYIVQTRRWILCAPLALMMSIALLDHGMTGLFGAIAILVTAAFSKTLFGDARRLSLAAAALVILAAGLICCAWPWYSFRQAVLWNRDNANWFNPDIWLMTLAWCAPAIVLALPAFALHRPLTRLCTAAALLAFSLGALAIVTKSPVLSRLPLPSLIFLHIPIGLFVSHRGLLKAGSWKARLHDLRRHPLADKRLAAAAECALALVLVFLLTPQLFAIAKQPYLARPYFAKVFHIRDLQLDLKSRYDHLLAPVADDDVVLADQLTGWPVPSSHGRIVSALHYELFVPDQPQRSADVDVFFDPSTSDATRRQILARYHVRWILINKDDLSPEVYSLLTTALPTRGQDRELVLLDADKWLDGPTWKAEGGIKAEH